MEVVLDLCSSEHTADAPLICLDEAAHQLPCDLYPSIEMEPGATRRRTTTTHARGCNRYSCSSIPIAVGGASVNERVAPALTGLRKCDSCSIWITQMHPSSNSSQTIFWTLDNEDERRAGKW